MWVQMNPDAKDEVSVLILLNRFTSKLDHTFRNLKTKLYHVIQERDEMQSRIEQQQEKCPLQWENVLGDDEIEHPNNLITTTTKNLSPSISIF